MEKHMEDLAIRQNNLSHGRRSSARMLKKSREYWQKIRAYHRFVRNVPDRLLSLVPSAQWLIDNFYVVDRETKVIMQNFCRKSLSRLPSVKEGPYKGYPVIYMAAKEMLKATDMHLDEDNIITLLNAYQRERPLSIAELWAFSNVLKICLIESINEICRGIVDSIMVKQKADRIMDEILGKPWSHVDEVGERLVRKMEKDDIFDFSYLVQILFRLKEIDVEEGFFKQCLLNSRCNENFDVSAAIRNEARHQAALQVKISSAITSLIQVSAIDWEKLFERISMVEAILSRDPSGVYPRMDFATRDSYHHEVEKLAARLRVTETEIADRAVELSRISVELGHDGAKTHVGYYIIGKGRKVLENSFGYRPGLVDRFSRWIRRNPGSVYFPAAFLITAIITLAVMLYTVKGNPGIGWALLALTAFFSLILSSAIALEIVNYIFSRCIRPRKLPRLDFEKRIHDDCRTMVVMPVIIDSRAQLRKYFQSIESYYLANRDKNLFFAILGDFKDAKQQELPEDSEIVNEGAAYTRNLNLKYAGREEGPFYFFLRSRKWNESEGCWMGWERKRGKLEEFNCLLLGSRDTSYSVIVGDTEIFPTIRYVITIDADTELTRGSAAMMIGIMAHPLNKPVLNADSSKVIDGYALLQPRIGIRANSVNATLFSRTFAGQAGVDPYTNAVSDIYQDLFCEGSFTGKGIYDLRVFHRVLTGTIPENSVLSHDLLEGCFVRCALATDVELMDGYPSTVISFFTREHRWIRGDWQLLPWLLGRDSLNALSRWKIFDNLRRSLIPISQLGLILIGLLVTGWNPLVWIALVLSSTLLSLVVNLSGTTVLWLKKCGGQSYVSNLASSLYTTVLQGVLLFALIPYRAYISLDAIIRALYRLLISHKRMLEWKTAEAVEKSVSNSLGTYVRKMWAGPLSGAFIMLFAENGLMHAAAAALKAVSLEAAAVQAEAASRVAASVQAAIQAVAPSAIAAQAVVAVLWFLSPVLGYLISRPYTKGDKPFLKPEEIREIRRLARKTWRYFEEFFTPQDNWLTPDNYQEYPGDVLARRTSPTNMGMQLLSTLSARDLGYIGLNRFIDRLDKFFSTLSRMELWNGHLYNWYDTRTLDILYPRYVSTVDSGNFLAALVVLKTALKEIKETPLLGRAQYDGLADAARLAGVGMDAGLPGSCREWKEFLESLEKQAVGKDTTSENDEWRGLFLNQCRCLLEDIEVFGLTDWEGAVPTLMDLYRRDNPRAVELVSKIDAFIVEMEKRIREMDFRLLYDHRRNLFRVGFNVSANSPDGSYYDLMASESRLTSFLAIAKEDAPRKHWFKLGRPLTLFGGKAVLVSWSGTMFEYLLPNLLMKVFPGTLLEQTCKTAVKAQIEYGRKKNVPWGISESGYYRFDQLLNYQYRAFGVPALGFKSDLRKNLVIAPYASILAISVAPREVYRNIKLLQSLNAEGRYGFYEAIDFISPMVQDPRKCKIIQSFMIHHQGMSLVALNNFLNENIMQQRFHRDPMVKSTELLLEERQPHGIIVQNDGENVVPSIAGIFANKKQEPRVVRSTRLRYPVAHVLSNNRYSVMITSNGNGISTCNEMAVNRWRPVAGSEGGGMFFYIRNTRNRKYWSATYFPTAVEPDSYRVAFSPDKVEFKRVDGHIETRTGVVVSPENDVEIRRIILTNRGMEQANLEVTSYFEPVLDTLEGDLSHPAFSKLFVSTEYVEGRNMLIAARRPRKGDEKRKYLFNAVFVKGKMNGEVEYETDRAGFIGRGNTLKNPRVIKADLPLSGTVGNVLDPIMSLRVNVTIPPGRSAMVTYIVGTAETREKAIEMGTAYQSLHAIEDVFKMAYVDSEVEMQYLGITSRQVNTFQDLVGSIYYPAKPLRAPAEILEKNTLGQSGLWKFCISGDNPIMLFRISDVNHIDALKEAVSAYEYLRKNGVRLDFVILNEEDDDYYQHLGRLISDVVSNRKIYYPNAKNKGIYVLNARSMSREEIFLLLTVARVVLSGRSSLMSKRTRRLLSEEFADGGARILPTVKRQYEEIPLPARELKWFNGIGGFSEDGREYVTVLKGEHDTPAPWINVISNDSFGFFVSASGAGYTWSVNSRENKLTAWSNDPVTDPLSEAVYIRDDETGEVFSPTPSPIRGKEPYRIRHGFGYSVFEHGSHGIMQTMTVFASGRDPVKVYKIRLENKLKESRKISLFFFVEWVLGTMRDFSAPYIVTRMDTENNLMTAMNTYNTDYKGRVAFLSSSERISSYTADRGDFIGNGGDLSAPQALRYRDLSERTGAGLDPCGAVKVDIWLKAEDSHEVIFVLGEAKDYESAVLLAETYRRPPVAEVALAKVRASWKHILEQIQVKTPDESLDVLLNGWLLYQVLSCRIRSRSAFYQNGGAFGFRDQLQDVLALLHTEPRLCREHIIRCCGRQFKEGDVQHWWHDDTGKGVRTKISDDLLWLPYVTATYISVTGDTGILEQKVNFLEGETLGPEEHEKYFMPSVSEEKDTVYRHCLLAIERGLNMGERGLPLMGSGDWNDGMNRVGCKGRGESVWLAWFLYKVLKDFIPLCRLMGDEKTAAAYEETAGRLAEAVEKNAWDGEWYLRAYFDSGQPLGSRLNNECRIDSISQSWGIISRGADPERARTAMESLRKYLVNEEEQIVLLLTPAFDKSQPDPGYIRGYPPGIRENGGQYTHAAVWSAIAFAEMGDGDTAYELMRMLNPVNHTRTYTEMMKYKLEPYVMPADVYSRFPHAGRGGWSWYTGSASWMYQAGTHWILGIRRKGDRLMIDPVIPRDWKGFSAVYRFGRTRYLIEVENPKGLCRGVVSITLDGTDATAEGIPLRDDGTEHKVVVTMG